MPERIVVSYRGVVPADEGGGERYLARALALKKRAGALGGTLCAWSAQTFAFDFAPDELEEALTAAMLTCEGEALLAPIGERFGAGVSQGDLRVVGDSGSLAILSWGMALVSAVALAREARGGEALLDRGLLLARGDELDEVGFGVEGMREQRLMRTREPEEPPPRASFPPSMRGSWPGAPPASGLVPVSSAKLAPSVEPPSEEPIVEDTPVEEPPFDDSPITERASQPATFTGPPGELTDALEPAHPGVELAELAKQALLQGDVSALERLVSELRVAGAHEDLVERMSGMIELEHGDTAEGLRRLRAAVSAVVDPSQIARARLAYGVALAAAGRTEGALLEGLEALARAREASDPHGEHACALFLARLSSAAGQRAAAGAWAFIAARSGT